MCDWFSNCIYVMIAGERGTQDHQFALPPIRCMKMDTCGGLYVIMALPQTHSCFVDRWDLTNPEGLQELVKSYSNDNQYDQLLAWGPCDLTWAINPHMPNWAWIMAEFQQFEVSVAYDLAHD